MINDLVPPPGAHEGKFDEQSEIERNDSALKQEAINSSMDALFLAQKAWADHTAGELLKPASQRRLHTDPQKSREIRKKAVAEANADIEAGKVQNKKKVESMIQDVQKEQAEDDRQLGNSNRPTINSDKKLRMAHGTGLSKAFDEKWRQHKQEKRDRLKHEQRQKMDTLEADLSAQDKEKKAKLNNEQTKALEEKETALKAEMQQKLTAFKQAQKTMYDSQTNIWTKEKAENLKQLTHKNEFECNAATKSLDEEHATMKKRLDAGIQAYTDELGSKDGMTKMAERLYPGADHGDPSEDVKV